LKGIVTGFDDDKLSVGREPGVEEEEWEGSEGLAVSRTTSAIIQTKTIYGSGGWESATKTKGLGREICECDSVQYDPMHGKQPLEQ